MLTTAAHYPALKGSKFVGSRGVRDLYVCRACGALWRTWYDRREDYQCWSEFPRNLLPVFAADTDLTRLVSWVAAHYTKEHFGLIHALATKLIRRRPEGLQSGTAALFRFLGELVPPKDAAAAERLEMLFHLRKPIRNGARFTDSVRHEMTQIARGLQRGRSNADRQAYETLCTILEEEKDALEADARCVLALD